MPSQDTVKWSSLCLLLLSLCLALPVPSPADDGLLQQVDIGLLSIGGRAMYYDPKEGDANWYGGAQVRLHPWHYFAIEGSADYRRNDYAGGTSAHSYPVQVSALIYPLGTTRLAPFILGGGGWYYTTAQGRGDSTIRRTASGFMRAAGCSSSSIDIFPSTAPIAISGSKRSNPRTRNIVDKKFNDNGHMITIGVNFHL